MGHDQTLNYYNSAEIWAQPPTKHQLEIAQLVIDKIPNDVYSILDIGSGNGIITNPLVPKYGRVCAVDISEEALKYVTAEKRIGSIDQLPFRDGEFDLVLVTDVLEHLPNSIFLKGIQEIQRVAGKYVLIVTPFQEKLEFGQMNCVNCDCSFHVNLHIRSVTKELLEESFSSFQLKKFLLCGDEWPHIPPHAKKLRSMYEYSNHWDYAVCPLCGSHQNGQVKKTDPGFYEAVIDTLHHVIEPFRLTELHRNEALLLFEKDGRSKDEYSKSGGEDYSLIIKSPDVKLQDITLEVIDRWSLPFGNPFFERENTVYFDYKPYVLISDNMNLSQPQMEDGVTHRSVIPKESATNHAIFVLPKFTDEEFDVCIEYKDTSNEVLVLNVYDRLKSYIHLGELEACGDQQWKKKSFLVPKGIKCSPEGFVFELTTSDSIQKEHPIRSITVNGKKTQVFVPDYQVDQGQIVVKYGSFLDKIIEENCILRIRSNETVNSTNIEVFVRDGKSKVYLDHIYIDGTLGLFKLTPQLFHLLHGDPVRSKLDLYLLDKLSGSPQALEEELKGVEVLLDAKAQDFIGLHQAYEKTLVDLQNVAAELEIHRKIKAENEKEIVSFQNKTAELESLLVNAKAELERNNKIKLNYEQLFATLQSKVAHSESKLADTAAELEKQKRVTLELQGKIDALQDKKAELELILANTTIESERMKELFHRVNDELEVERKKHQDLIKEFKQLDDRFAELSNMTFLQYWKHRLKK